MKKGGLRGPLFATSFLTPNIHGRSTEVQALFAYVPCSLNIRAKNALLDRR